MDHTNSAIMSDDVKTVKSGIMQGESEMKYRNYIDHAPDAFFIIDDKGCFIEANNSASRITGFSNEELLQMSTIDLFAEKYVSDTISHFKKVKETGAATGDLWCRRKDGTLRCVTLDTVKLSEDRFMSFAKDITDRKKIEQSLLLEKSFSDNLFDASTDTIFLFEPETGKPVRWNRFFSKVSGYTDNEIANMKAPDDFYNRNDLEKAEACICRILAEGQGVVELSLLTKKGTYVPFEYAASIVKTPDGKTLFLSIGRDLTERKRMEQELLKLASAVHYSGELVNLATIDGNMTFLNEAGGRMLGIDPEEVEHINIMQVIPDHLKELVQTELLPALMERGTWEGDLQYRNLKTGQVTDVHAMTFTVTCPGTEPVKFLANVSLDITKRKRAENELAERNRFIESLINMTPDIIYIYDLVEKKNVYSNKGIETTLGYSVEEIRSMGDQVIPLLMHPDDLAVYLQTTLKKYVDAKDRERIIHQYRMKHKSGDWRWLASSEIIFSREPDGSPKQIFGMIHDITGNKNSEDALRESKVTAERYLNIAAEIIMSLDDHGNITLLNDSGHALLGYAKGELIGRNWFDACIEQNIVEELKEVFGKLMAGDIEIVENYENPVITKSGEQKLIFWHNSVLKDDNDRIFGLLCSGEDITEKQKLLESSQRTDKLESLGVLAGGIAHDFNNLLGGLFGYIDLARECSNENDTISEYLDNALAAFNRAKDLTRQLLTFSKGGAPARKTGCIKQVIVENAKFVLSGSNVKCEFHMAEDLLPCSFDSNQIGQVIDNIIINAQQAMPLGGRIVITAQNVILKKGEIPSLEEGAYAKVSITDTGTGIQPKIIKRIFDPFFTTKQKGNGLGLATCYSIMQRHGGLIDVESVLDTGTTFHIFLPAAESNSDSKRRKISTRHQGSGNFLIMDDEKIVLNLAGDLLETMGYSIIKAESGEQAIRILAEAQKKQIPVVGALLDLTIPGGMSGKETALKLQKMYPGLPLFASSGYSEDPIMTRPAEHGFTDSISKPYRKSELAEMLNRHKDRLK